MKIFGFLVAFLVGVFISTAYFYVRESSNKNSFVPVQIPVPSAVTARLQVFNDAEIAEYYKLTDEKMKALKGEIILSKFVTLFLPDLGVVVPPQLRDEAQARLNRPKGSDDY